MIRKRIPGKDDLRIYSLVKHILLPIKRQSFPHAQVSKKDVLRRIKTGATYVITGAGTDRTANGFIHYVIRTDMVWLDLLAVEAEFRNKGYGKALVRLAESAGKRNGCDRIFVYVDAVNAQGRQFYTNRGYVPVRYDPNSRCYRYEKWLTD